MIQDAIRALVERRAITGAEAADALEQIMAGEATPAQIGALLAGLRMVGETPEVVAACLAVTQRHAEPVPAADVIDIVGTGADGMDTFNVSTAAAIVVAGAGVRVAKHGNRAATSKCGAADVLEALGARLDLTGEQAAAVIDACGFCFLFAQRYHPALRHVGGPRRELGTRTIFNLLGPLTNPAQPRAMLVGVGAKAFGPLVAESLRLRGLARGMVVHSADGLDEISPAGVTHGWVVGEGAVEEIELTPEQFGLPAHPVAKVIGGDPQANAGAMLAVLDGGEGPVTDFVVMNAAAALHMAGAAPDLGAGVAAARESIASGRAREVLDQYVALTQELAGG
ncbi:MAG: anthranilate phosphoribosyltransferase [Chloroflexi bacterium]|nr:anthranilate phosphoribosyltransferase [Chloroflexota bacterium]